MGIIKQFLNFLLFLTSFYIVGQELPLIKNYASEVYGAENQNWSISQSEDKYIYLANNSGLLEFNGAKWRLYSSPNNTILRSVNAIGDKIYTGAYMEFGFWEKNIYGNLEYTSLSAKLKESLIEEDFWSIIDFDKWILFQSLNRIYIYDTVDKSFRIIDSENRLPKAFKIDESIYFQKLNEGVFRIESGEPVLVSEDNVFKENILVDAFELDDKVLYLTQTKGFYYLDKDNNVHQWNVTTNPKITDLSVYSSLQLANGNLVLGTISNGIFELDKKGNVLLQIDQEEGLNNNTVLSMFEDVDNNLWLGLDNGVSVVNMNSPFSVYNDFGGKLGSVYTSVIFNNKLYLGTNQGLFYKEIGSNNDFKFITDTDGQVWCFKVHDNTLFCGHNKGTFIVEGDKADLIPGAMGTMAIKSIKGNEDKLIQGYYYGLNIIEKVNDTWKLRNKIVGFDPTTRFFDFTNDDSILVFHEYKGLFKLDINDDFTQVNSFKILESAPKALKAAISEYNGDLLYTSHQGIFKYNYKEDLFKKDEILSEKFLKDDEFISGKLVLESKTNTLWGFTDKSIIYFSPGKLNSTLQSTKIYVPASLRGNLTGFESVINLKEELYLFGTSRGYLILDKSKINTTNFKISINSIEKKALDDTKQFVPLNREVEFSSKENNLNFTFSVPEFNKFNQVTYQYQLEGYYDKWSNWSTDSEASFENLPYGRSYTFNVRAQIGNTLSTNTATYSFVIDRPWYLSNQSIVIYSFLFVALLLLVHSLYKRHYSKQKKKLIDQKQREFSLSQLKSEKEIMKLKNEKLQHEIDSKTRELSASTMSIVKKNEILNTIKGELSAIKDKEKIKPVIKIINKNLSNTSDWKLFQEAFNNADSDFLKKIKELHPNLTPNDLRLCAYLRLNLSSKEIAPLLNISARSVEIKRYRLRKKMELAHEKSLVEYILEV